VKHNAGDIVDMTAQSIHLPCFGVCTTFEIEKKSEEFTTVRTYETLQSHPISALHSQRKDLYRKKEKPLQSRIILFKKLL
jgi:hypothetical protein